jgi:hypothetical protein
MLSNFLFFYLPKNNRFYEHYEYLSSISIRSFVPLAYPLLFLILLNLLSVYFVNSLVMLLLCCYFSLYQCIWLYENKDICENKTSLLYMKYSLSQVLRIVKARPVVKLVLQDSAVIFWCIYVKKLALKDYYVVYWSIY